MYLVIPPVHNTAFPLFCLGEAYICIPDRLSWTKRWCVLHSSVLEIYSSTTGPESSPVFSLPLQPNLVEVSLAGDKRHRSAIRLSAPSLSTVPLFLDASGGDTVVMGSWIRGIIQALGHIKQTPPTPVASPTQRRYSEIANTTTTTPITSNNNDAEEEGGESDSTTEPLYDEVASAP